MVGDYQGFDTYNVTMWYTKTIAVIETCSEVCPTMEAASFDQSLYNVHHLHRGVLGTRLVLCMLRM